MVGMIYSRNRCPETNVWATEYFYFNGRKDGLNGACTPNGVQGLSWTTFGFPQPPKRPVDANPIGTRLESHQVDSPAAIHRAPVPAGIARQAQGSRSSAHAVAFPN